MLVYFLRHAEAEDGNGSDFDRALTSKGLDQAEKVGKFLVRFGLLPEVILSSPVLRARQTAEIVARKVTEGKLDLAPWLACGMAPENCLQELSGYARCESVLVCGHEPDFSQSITHWMGSNSSGQVRIRKASLTALDVHQFREGGAELQFLVTVRLM